MYERSRKREVRLTNKEIAKRTKSSERMEMRFIGTPRCGMNAIAKWILMHFQGYSFYRGKPLRSANHDKPFYVKYLKGITRDKKNLVARNKGDKVCIGFCWDRLPFKNCTNTPSAMKKRINVLVLRDPFNQFSSIEKAKQVWDKKGLSAIEYIELRKLWMNHAQAFVNHDQVWDGKVLRILFNRWATDEKYRAKILKVLGDSFSYDDVGIPKLYAPSPFKNEKVVKRFDQMKNSNPMRAMIGYDNTMKTLCRKIFGWSA